MFSNHFDSRFLNLMVLKIEKRVDPNEMPQYSFAAFAYDPILECYV